MDQNMPKGKQLSLPKRKPYDEVEDIFNPRLQNELRNQRKITGFEGEDTSIALSAGTTLPGWGMFMSAVGRFGSGSDKPEGTKATTKDTGTESEDDEKRDESDNCLDEEYFEDEEVGKAFEDLTVGKMREAVLSSRSSEGSTMKSFTTQDISVELEGFTDDQLDSLNDKINRLMDRAFQEGTFPKFTFTASTYVPSESPTSQNEEDSATQTEPQRSPSSKEQKAHTGKHPCRDNKKSQTATSPQKKEKGIGKKTIKSPEPTQEIKPPPIESNTKDTHAVPHEITEGIKFGGRLSYIKTEAIITIGTFGLTEEIILGIINDEPGIGLLDLIQKSLERAGTWPLFSSRYSLAKRVQ